MHARSISRSGGLCGRGGIPARTYTRSDVQALQVFFHQSSSRVSSVQTETHINSEAAGGLAEVSRRSLLASGLLLAPALGPMAAAAGVAEVGNYLPPAEVGDLVKYDVVKTPLKTPGMRSGIVPPTYAFGIPPSWIEERIANILSGNFCLPNCGEPWTEAIFSNPAEGKLSLLVYPLVKLTNKKNVTIEALGTPEALLPRIGSFLTGTYLDEEDVISSGKKTVDGEIYYCYEVYAPAANGHSLSVMTVKGDLAYLFLVTATDRQWSKSQAELRKVVDTFHA